MAFSFEIKFRTQTFRRFRVYTAEDTDKHRDQEAAGHGLGRKGAIKRTLVRSVRSLAGVGWKKEGRVHPKPKFSN